MTKQMSGYYDYASATPLDAGILQKMMPFFSTEFYNPSTLYSTSDKASDAIEQARKSVAANLGVRQNEIVFTSGCTESNNLAIHGIMQEHPDCKVLISAIEHESVRKSASRHNFSEIPVDSNGVIDLEALSGLITDDVVLVSIIYVNNETGVAQPIRKVAEIIAYARKRRGTSGKPLYLHTDAAQAPNVATINQNSLGFDMMSLNGGKIYGPKGSGCLYVGPNVRMGPHMDGGGQELGLRSGTENTPAIVGFAIALSAACKDYKAESERLEKLQAILTDGLNAIDCKIIAYNAPRASSILSIILPGIDSETMVYRLDKLGIYVSSGSACHAKTGEKSHVLSAMGYSETDSMSTIRISMGKYTATSDIDKLIASIKHILASK